MSELSEQQVIRLAMAPFHVIYAVASAQFSPSRITRRQIIRAVEYGLVSERELGEKIFDLLKMNLHEFYARFPRDFSEDFTAKCLRELRGIHRLLRDSNLPPEMTADFEGSLRRLAFFVAEGSVFSSQETSPVMKERAEDICAIFDSWGL